MYQQPAVPTTSGVSVTAMILGICTLVIPFAGFVTGPLAVILGAYGQSEVKKSRGALKGGGMATAGLVTGIIGCVGYLGFFILMGAGASA